MNTPSTTKLCPVCNYADHPWKTCPEALATKTLQPAAPKQTDALAQKLAETLIAIAYSDVHPDVAPEFDVDEWQNLISAHLAPLYEQRDELVRVLDKVVAERDCWCNGCESCKTISEAEAALERAKGK